MHEAMAQSPVASCKILFDHDLINMVAL